jgi:hypothetical protein
MQKLHRNQAIIILKLVEDIRFLDIIVNLTIPSSV